MNKLVVIAIMIFSNVLNAQVAIGKNAVNGNNTILDFSGTTATQLPSDAETTNTKGIILPSLDNTPTFPVVNPTTNNTQNGTFIFDKTSKKVKMFENGLWKDMSEEGSTANLINNSSAEKGQGVIIGNSTTTAQGVLVLESSNKALILPHVKNPNTSIKSPYPGMMCYDTISNSIAVFDGVSWSYWK